MDNRKLLELTVDEHKELFFNHFDEIFWKNAKQLGVEITGKDITKVKDVRCIRETFDASTKCRRDKEKIKDSMLTETGKKIVQYVLIAIFIVGTVLFVNAGAK